MTATIFFRVGLHATLPLSYSALALGADKTITCGAIALVYTGILGLEILHSISYWSRIKRERKEGFEAPNT